ncbi:MAG: heme exporter protein CcmB [Arenicella sp.]
MADMLQQSSLISSFRLFFSRELALLIRNRTDTVQPFSFFIIVVFLFPLSLSPESNLLKQIMPSCIWVSVVLAIMMGLDNLFRSDFEDGSLEQWLIHYRSLPMIVFAKILAHWCTTGLLLSVIATLLCMAIDIPGEQISVLFISLVLGTLSLQSIGAIGAALTVSLRRSGMLLAVVVLPLYIPVLIFGSGLVARAGDGASVVGPLYILAAIVVLAITLSPLAISAALKNTID